MQKIIITEFMDQSAVDALAKDFDVIYDKNFLNSPEKLAAEMKTCDAIIVRNKTQVRGELLEQAERLKIVGRLGVGLDNIDVATCKQRGIEVIPATGANNISVAEYVMAGALMAVRGCYEKTHEVQSGTWPRESMMGGEVYGKTLGLIGFGGIAQDVARRASVFGMNIVAYDPFIEASAPVWNTYGGAAVKPLSLEELCAQADIISLHVPLTDATKNLINQERIQNMKNTAIIINTARGGIVDEQALANALKAQQLGFAVFDVFNAEPLLADSPFKDVSNCILTAHIAGVTHESNTRISTLIADKVAAGLKASA